MLVVSFTALVYKCSTEYMSNDAFRAREINMSNNAGLIAIPSKGNKLGGTVCTAKNTTAIGNQIEQME